MGGAPFGILTSSVPIDPLAQTDASGDSVPTLWTGGVIRDYRRRQHAGTIGCLVAGLLPVLGALAVVLRGLSLGANPPFGLVTPTLVVLLAGVLGFPAGLVAHGVVSLVALAGFRCPRCGLRFAGVFPPRTRCRHCGLRAFDAP